MGNLKMIFFRFLLLAAMLFDTVEADLDYNQVVDLPMLAKGFLVGEDLQTPLSDPPKRINNDAGEFSLEVYVTDDEENKVLEYQKQLGCKTTKDVQILKAEFSRCSTEVQNNISGLQYQRSQIGDQQRAQMKAYQDFITEKTSGNSQRTFTVEIESRKTTIVKKNMGEKNIKGKKLYCVLQPSPSSDTSNTGSQGSGDGSGTGARTEIGSGSGSGSGARTGTGAGSGTRTRTRTEADTGQGGQGGKGDNSGNTPTGSGGEDKYKVWYGDKCTGFVMFYTGCMWSKEPKTSEDQKQFSHQLFYWATSPLVIIILLQVIAVVVMKFMGGKDDKDDFDDEEDEGLMSDVYGEEKSDEESF